MYYVSQVGQRHEQGAVFQVVIPTSSPQFLVSKIVYRHKILGDNGPIETWKRVGGVIQIPPRPVADARSATFD